MNSEMLILQEGARLLGIELKDSQIDLFDRYQSELRFWNAKTNLISENTEREIVTRHFLDSLTAFKFIIKQNAQIVDIGCGAGFPGIPLKIVLPSLQLYLLESNRKKASFLKYITRCLNLENTFILNDRTENIIRDNNWRQKFDIVISRAALKLPDLLALSNHFLSQDGLLIALKGHDVATEWAAIHQILHPSIISYIIQEDINIPLLGPPRKIIIFPKVK